jgi:long-chain acyl-CoA synthetase
MVTYADQPWLNHYDEGVPRTLHPYPSQPVHAFLRQSALADPGKTALITTARLPGIGHQPHRLSYRDLDDQSDWLAAGLLALGLEKGDRVALIMPNSTAFVISFYGILKAGGVVAGLNPTYPPAKLRDLLNDSGATMAVVTSNLYSDLRTIVNETSVKRVIVTNLKEYMSRLVRLAFERTQERKGGHRVDRLEGDDVFLHAILRQHRGERPGIEVAPNDAAMFQYTGGTTGTPKCAIATHSALVANTLQTVAWSSSKIPGMPVRRSDFISMASLPMFHVYGLVVQLNQAIASGYTLIMIPDPRDTNMLVDILTTFQVNVLMGVPALYQALNSNPAILSGKASYSSIKLAMSGAAPMHHTVKENFEAAGGRSLTEAYGLSEMPAGSISNPLVGTHKRDSIGIPLPDVDARVVDLESGERLMPVGEAGELILRGPHMMAGYHNSPDETAFAMREFEGERWVYTGDVAFMDEEGYFFLIDRKKDMALIGGFNVYPAQIDKILLEHPAVRDVATTSVPHPKAPGQEALKAWVVVEPGESIKSGELIAFCKDYLAPYEIPRRYAFVAELPRSFVGKALRRELVRMETERSSRRSSSASVDEDL